MPLVKVKEKFQVTIPTELREALHVTVGDLLEATMENETIVLKPKAVVDRREAWNGVSEVMERVHAKQRPVPKTRRERKRRLPERYRPIGSTMREVLTPVIDADRIDERHHA